MAEERDARIGRTAPPVHMRVEHGKIREFAKAVKDPNPLYFDEAAAKAEAGGIVPPPTFTMTMAHWTEGVIGGPKLDMDLRRVLHGEQEFEYVKPVHAGDELTATGTITNVFKKAGKRGGEMTFAIVETKFENQCGEVVLYSRSTIIETAKAVEK